MKQQLENIKEKASLELTDINTINDLEAFRINYLGKNGSLTAVLKQMGKVSAEERPIIGQLANEIRASLEKEIAIKEKQLIKIAIEKELLNGTFDTTYPSKNIGGTLHPITIVQKEIEDIFKTMGFIIEDGFEIENEYNNFEALNIPKHHPARDMQDTYYLDNGQLLKTHTSAAQNRIMRKYKAPLKVLFPGRCFRNEATDASHDNTFFQMEGLMIGEDVSISNLIYFMKSLLSEVFKKDVKVRLRPGFFPFVEPGFELDINCLICGGEGCPTCHQSGWLELLPCGMIHPSVLEMGGIDTEKYTGFAFGLGLTRLTMMKYGINDIRVLNSGNLKVLKQFDVR
ncbi:MAG: phenylalanine--tRNA ligase subunit alpha [Clostridia bacterium]